MAPAGFDVPRLRRFYSLFDLGRVSGRTLYIRAVPVADVFASDMGSRGSATIGTRVVGWVARLDAFVDMVSADHTRGFDPMGAGWISFHLLLLSRSILQSVLGGPDLMRRRRAATQLPRRKLVPVDPAKHS